MKKLFFSTSILFTLLVSASAQQASIAGNWSGEFKDPEGKSLPFKLSIADGTFQFDIGADGTVDSKGEYTLDGDRVTIWDTAGQNICPADQKGVYSFSTSGDMLTFTKVSDACPGRGDAPLVLKRM